MRANAGLLLQRTDLAEEDRQAALRDIAMDSERMGRLIGDLLTLARADAGQQLSLQRVDVAALVEDVAGQAARLYVERRLGVWSEACCVLGDAEALTQLVWILVDNAQKYTTAGGRIDLHLVRGDGLAELTVADDGIGVPAEALDHIFERFYRADAARSGGGSGLGLSIARWIVEQHGGQIEAPNRGGGGAAFTVRLPLTEADS